MATDEEVADYLAHHGVLGMKWGVHRARSQAESDANEYVKAKLFYGQGAGTRRKLINATVAQRSKNPEYKKHFDAAVARQDLSKRASQATRTRRRKDASASVGKTVRGVHRSLTGGFGNVTVTAAVIAAGATYLHKTGADAVLLKKAATVVTPVAVNIGKNFAKNFG